LLNLAKKSAVTEILRSEAAVPTAAIAASRIALRAASGH
jgi:hypothetical protein